MPTKYLLRLVLLCGCVACLPAFAQDKPEVPSARVFLPSTNELLEQNRIAWLSSTSEVHSSLMPVGKLGYSPRRSKPAAGAFGKISWNSSPGTIGRMESAFYCNDTPFVDQVRLPLATFWSGRVKLTGFESDVTTANFVLGLPGQGSLHTLSAFGNAFIATHTPPSDQLAGIHLTLSLRPTQTNDAENSGRRGIEYLVRASRGFLPFLSARSDSVSFPVR